MQTTLKQMKWMNCIEICHRHSNIHLIATDILAEEINFCLITTYHHWISLHTLKPEKA